MLNLPCIIIVELRLNAALLGASLAQEREETECREKEDAKESSDSLGRLSDSPDA